MKYYRIIRRTSKYNKYIKWYLECFRDKNAASLLSTSGYRTKNEAETIILARNKTSNYKQLK